ncbi:MAG: histidine kinase [Acidobacteria bacterium]|nr:histidine kinase [Acidobacteriota bacterium]
MNKEDVKKTYSVSLMMIFLWSVLLVANHEAIALDRNKALTQYSHTVWHDKDGLPQNTVRAITQTRDGYLWIGTEGGLARFDGVRFTVFDRANTKEIRNNSITALYESQDGSLWIGTAGGGLVRFFESRFTTYTKANGMANNFIRAITEDRAGHLWIGTTDGLSSFRDGLFTTYRTANGLPANVVRTLNLDRRNDLWIGTSVGLARLTNGEFVVYTTKDGLSHDSIRTICEDRQGNLWIGTEGSGINRLKGGVFTVYTTKDGLSSDLIRSINVDSEDNLWIGTAGGGLNRLAGGKFSTFGIREGLSTNFVRSIHEDREGNLWVGTEGGGLHRFSDGKVTTVTTKEGLSSDFVKAVYEDAKGELWIGTEGGGLNRLRGGKVTVFGSEDGIPNNPVKALYGETKGSLWIGTDGGGLVRLKNGKAATYTERDGLLGMAVFAICGDREGNVWVGTGNGLNRLRNGRVTTYTKKDGLLDNRIRALHAGRDGSLWIGFRDSGLTRLKDGQFTVYTEKEGMPDVSVFSFHEDGAGELWMATDGGLVRLREGAFTTFTTRQGLFDDTLYRILEDDRGRLWVSSSKGIFHVSKRELDAVAAGRTGAVSSVSFTTADGMISSECTGGSQPAGWRTREGKLWFPTVRGLVMIDPEAEASNKLPPLVHIEQVIVDKKPIVANEKAQLPAGTVDVDFYYTALSFVAPERVRFRYKLEGMEKEWTEAGTRRVAYYTNLPPGNYRFRVMASNNDGVWNAAGASFDVSIKPYFYQTHLFYALCAVALALASWSIYRLRIKQLKTRFSAILEERNRIAREIHDTLAQGFAGISMQLEAGKEMLFVSPQMANEHLDQANLLARSCLEEARQYVWDLRHHIEGNDLASVMASMARNLTTGLRLDFKVLGAARPVSDNVESNILRIGQEAIINVVKHARARQIQVELCYASQSLRLCVRDDGCGFDARHAPAADGHYGLLGMSERARSIGGSLRLHSIPGKGTEINVEVTIDNKLGRFDV